MRVVSGSAKGRQLRAPKGESTRPTSDFVREAIFNSLQAVIDLEGCSVADLFAGTGALGIEALSRGAATCTFVESDRRAVATIRENLASTGLVGGVVVPIEVEPWIRRGPGWFDLVFADPPYAYDQWPAIGAVEAGCVVAESDREIDLGERWRVLRVKRYGSTVVSLFEPRSTT